MAALTVGAQAPEFKLRTVSGNDFSLPEALARGPVVLAFFKVSCPVCQYAFPYFDRLYRGLQGSGVQVVGVSQDSLRDTRDFMKEFGVTFDIALDDEENHYAVSTAYGLTNVPTVFEIDAEGKIVRSIVGWSRNEIAEIHRKYAPTGNQVPLYKTGEEVAEFRPG